MFLVFYEVSILEKELVVWLEIKEKTIKWPHLSNGTPNDHSYLMRMRKVRLEILGVVLGVIERHIFILFF